MCTLNFYVWPIIACIMKCDGWENLALNFNLKWCVSGFEPHVQNLKTRKDVFTSAKWPVDEV